MRGSKSYVHWCAQAQSEFGDGHATPANEKRDQADRHTEAQDNDDWNQQLR